ncbi:YCF48-related protein [Thermaurantimonas aggregans]|uniref:YCF48-related protein n=1 Tax=Thermaurantimonas aggregans TaxID=2173829 RepID=UPI0023EF8ACF|nr:YCF48-related protein [Thermaurantimonas aggregans]MCX8149724.1 YCF48-related protein [Thermaurantimonas aggregans]
MRKILLPLLLIFTGLLRAQVQNEPTPTTQGLWGAAENSFGELFMVGNNGTIIKRNAGCTPQWNSVTSPTTSGLRAIAFTGDSIGIIVGVSGTMLRSTNHGNTWTSITSGTTAGLLDVVADDSVVIVVGGGATSGNVVIRSNNYGLTWTTVVNNLPAAPFSIAKVTDNTYVLCGVQGIVYRSTDKGLTWTAVTGPFAGTLSSVDFFDNLNGMICGQNGAVYKTTDGGISWTTINVNQTTFYNGGKVLKPWRYLMVGNGGAALQADSAGNGTAINLNTSQAMRVVHQYRDRIYIAGNQGLVYTIPYDGDYPTLFQENFCAFTDSVQPPVGWSNSSPFTNRVWRFDNPFPVSQSVASQFIPPFAAYQSGFFGSGADSAILTTPSFSTVGAIFPLVQWNEYVQPPLSGTMTMYIQAFSNGQWNTIYQSNGPMDGNAFVSLAASPKLKNTARRSARLPLPNQTGIQLRFIISGVNAVNGLWLIDDIRVINAPYDVRLESINYDSTCLPITTDSPEGVIFNSTKVDHYPILSRLQTPTGVIHRTVYETVAPESHYIFSLVNAPINISNGDSLFVSIISTDSSLSNNSKYFKYNFLTSSPGTNGASFTLCGNDTIQVNLSPSAGIAVQWLLNGNPYSNQPNISVFQPGVYTVTYSSGSCTITDSIVVNQILPLPNPLTSVQDTFVPATNLAIPIGTADSMRITITHATSGILTQTTVTNNFNYSIPNTLGSIQISVILYKSNCQFTYNKNAWIVSGLSLDENGLKALRIFPNPANSEIFLQHNRPIQSLRLLDASGKIVIEVQEFFDNVLNISSLKNGLYFIEVHDIESNTLRQKLIKI